MRKQQFTATQIAQVLKEYSNGKSVEELIREYGVSKVTIYNWRKKYGGMDAGEMKRMKELEEENHRLKRMYANLAMELDVAKYIIEKKL
jgi:putative transposase